jgi:hypothetical protein
MSSTITPDAIGWGKDLYPDDSNTSLYFSATASATPGVPLKSSIVTSDTETDTYYEFATTIKPSSVNPTNQASANASVHTSNPSATSTNKAPAKNDGASVILNTSGALFTLLLGAVFLL